MYILAFGICLRILLRILVRVLFVMCSVKSAITILLILRSKFIVVRSSTINVHFCLIFGKCLSRSFFPILIPASEKSTPITWHPECLIKSIAVFPLEHPHSSIMSLGWGSMYFLRNFCLSLILRLFPRA